MHRGIASDRQALFVAEALDSLVAAIGVYRSDAPKLQHTANIFGLYVRPDWRGQRISDGLIALSLAWARAHGACQARLAVVTSNTGAIGCYVRGGFRVYGVEPAVIHHAGVYHDELLMTRRL